MTQGLLLKALNPKLLVFRNRLCCVAASPFPSWLHLRTPFKSPEEAQPRVHLKVSTYAALKTLILNMSGL